MNYLSECKRSIEIDEPEPGSDWRELLLATRKEMEAEEIADPTC